MKLLSLLKGVRLDSAEQMQEFASSLGVEVSFSEIPDGDLVAFQQFAECASTKGAKSFSATIQKEGYPPLLALVVLKGS